MAPQTTPEIEAVRAEVVAGLGESAPSAIAAGTLLTGTDAAAEAYEWLRAHAHDEADPPASPGPGDTPSAAVATITAREREVLRLLADGLTNKQIAQQLRISAKTVMHHSVAIYRKLGVRGRSEATAFAFRHRLIDPSDRR
ncbi:response regulator transcription factor [Microbacterium hominis]|uniref:Response regulator transcription factor n=2 Tax=Microbacterium hominis TaxID=162426 RepID=A0A7D4PPT4_9MICO|nr:response regulator transcription factor [Microbacterium hominis]